MFNNIYKKINDKDNNNKMILSLYFLEWPWRSKNIEIWY
jgi:hypothetical protein